MDKYPNLPSSELNHTQVLRRPTEGTELQFPTIVTHFTGFAPFSIFLFSLLLSSLGLPLLLVDDIIADLKKPRENQLKTLRAKKSSIRHYVTKI